MLRVYNLFHNRNLKIVAISCFWIIGLVSGSLVALETATIHNSWTRSLAYSDLPVVGFLVILIFPFLLSAFFFKISMWKGILPLVYLKAFNYSWCAITFLNIFGYSGWLLRLLLLFSGSITVALLLWFWMRNSNYDKVGRRGDLLLCLVLTLIIGFIDYSVISPFGVYLLSYF